MVSLCSCCSGILSSILSDWYPLRSSSEYRLDSTSTGITADAEEREFSSEFSQVSISSGINLQAREDEGEPQVGNLQCLQEPIAGAINPDPQATPASENFVKKPSSASSFLHEDEPMKMDVNIEEPEEEEAAAFTCTMADFEENVNVGATSLPMLEDESIEKKKNIGDCGPDPSSRDISSSKDLTHTPNPLSPLLHYGELKRMEVRIGEEEGLEQGPMVSVDEDTKLENSSIGKDDDFDHNLMLPAQEEAVKRRWKSPDKKVVLFGSPGNGKSTVSNALVTGGIEHVVFNSSDADAGSSNEISVQTGRGWTVTDTACLGQEDNGPIWRTDPKHFLKTFLKLGMFEFSHIIFVKTARRLTAEDEMNWLFFKSIFEGAEDAFVILFTAASENWLEENQGKLPKSMAGIRTLSVDIPPISIRRIREEGQKNSRERSIQKLEDDLEEIFEARAYSYSTPNICRMDVPQLEKKGSSLLKVMKPKLWTRVPSLRKLLKYVA